MDFGSVERLPQLISIQLRWLEGHNKVVDAPVWRMWSPQEASLEVMITNNADADLILDSNDLMLLQTVRHPPESEYSAFQQSYGWNGLRKRGMWRFVTHPSNLMPRDTLFRENPPQARTPLPHSESPVRIRSRETFSWKVAVMGWLPNEYELAVQFQKYAKETDPFDSVLSNPLSLDVLTDTPLQDDVIEIHVGRRENTEPKSDHSIALGVVLKNKLQKEVQFALKGTKDDLDLADFLFCYGIDGQLLPWTKKVAGSTQVGIPVNGSLTLNVDAPEGTVVARANFYNAQISHPQQGPSDPNRYQRGWHWSAHWIAPSIRQQLDAAK
jgi:hypothetical protein